MNIIMEFVKISIGFGIVALIGYGLAWFDGERKGKSGKSPFGGKRNANHFDN